MIVSKTDYVHGTFFYSLTTLVTKFARVHNDFDFTYQ